MDDEQGETPPVKTSRVCSMCNKAIARRPLMLPGGEGKFAHPRCWLDFKRRAAASADESRASEAKRLHRQAKRATQIRNDGSQ